jgi:hypothetical protein
LHEVHSDSGAHRVDETPFPDWLAPETAAAAKGMSEADARTALGPLLKELASEP